MVFQGMSYINNLRNSVIQFYVKDSASHYNNFR